MHALLLLTQLHTCLGDLQHWCLTPKQNPCPLCVEITSYVLLAKVGDSLAEGDLSCSLNIIRWLINQQSYYGGFESTQVLCWITNQDAAL